MRLAKALATSLLVTGTCLAISPYRMDREYSESQANWVSRLQVIEIEHHRQHNADEWEFRCRVLENKRGQAPDKMSYWESWPYRMPDGKVEAPLWTGSGLERQLGPGSIFLGMGRDSQLLRAEREPDTVEANGKP